MLFAILQFTLYVPPVQFIYVLNIFSHENIGLVFTEFVTLCWVFSSLSVLYLSYPKRKLQNEVSLRTNILTEVFFTS